MEWTKTEIRCDITSFDVAMMETWDLETESYGALCTSTKD